MNLFTVNPSSATAAARGLARTTSIEWTEHTWNPFVGCSIKSTGCKNCYAMAMARRLAGAGVPSYQDTIHAGKWSGVINRSSDAIWAMPYKLRNAVIFVNSMSDFWHENARDEWRAEALRVMRETPSNQYQILTKRPENILPMLASIGVSELPANVWAGATVEARETVPRIAVLREVPAAIRFLSVEPLVSDLGEIDLTGIDWVITGGESGQGARFCDPKWVRRVRDQADAQGVAFFHKQWGSYRSNPAVCERGLSVRECEILDPHENGKGGALLDGVLRRSMPAKDRARVDD